MRKTVLIVMTVFALTACNNSQSDGSNRDNESANSEETAVTGNDKDEHGCLTSAGETWSQLKQNCIQIFNVAQRLNPVETKAGEAITSAFVLFNEDKSEAELFLPNTTSNAILKTTDKVTYENGQFKYDTKDSSLYVNGTRTYVAEEGK